MHQKQMKKYVGDITYILKKRYLNIQNFIITDIEVIVI